MPVDNNNESMKLPSTTTITTMTLSTTTATTNNVNGNQQKSDHSSSLNNGISKKINNDDTDDDDIGNDGDNKKSNASKNESCSTNDEIIKYYLKDFNDVITCFLCKGYLIDATTINECLHSFCKTCILKYFDDDDNNTKSRSCPKCNTQVHKTKPKLNIRSDPTRQDIVYKLVPGLYKNEMNRRKEFYRCHPDKAIGLSNEEKGEINGERLILSNDDQIQITIEYFPEVTNPYPLLSFNNNDENSNIKLTNLNQRRYLLVKSGMRVLHLKKFIQYKYELDQSIQVDFFYKHERLKDDYTIMDVAYIYSWRRNIPIPLYYLILEPNKTHDDYIWVNNDSKINFKSLFSDTGGRQQSLRQTRLQMRRISDSTKNNSIKNDKLINSNRRRIRSFNKTNNNNNMLVPSANSQSSPDLNRINNDRSAQSKRRNSISKFSDKIALTPLSSSSSPSMKNVNNMNSTSKMSDNAPMTCIPPAPNLSPLMAIDESKTETVNDINKEYEYNKRSLEDECRLISDHFEKRLATRKRKSDNIELNSNVESAKILNETVTTESIVVNDINLSQYRTETKTVEEKIENSKIPQQHQIIPSVSNQISSPINSPNSFLKIDENHKSNFNRSLNDNNVCKQKRHDSISSTCSSSSSSSSRSSSPMTLLNKIIKKVEEGSIQHCPNNINTNQLSPKIDSQNKETSNIDDIKSDKNDSDQLPELISANSIIRSDNRTNMIDEQQTNGDNGFAEFTTLSDSKQNSPSNSIQINSILESLATIVDVDNNDKIQSSNNSQINGVVESSKNGLTDSKSEMKSSLTNLNDSKQLKNLSPINNDNNINGLLLLDSKSSSMTTTANNVPLHFNGNSMDNVISSKSNISDFQEFQKLLYEQINKAATASSTSVVASDIQSSTTSTNIQSNATTRSMESINNTNHHHHQSIESSSN